MALRFPRTAINMLRDCANGSKATPFPRRLGLFLTNRCDFACPMCAVQDARDVGLARRGDMAFEIVDKVLAECAPHQPVVDLIGGEPLLYANLTETVRLASRRKVLAAVTTNGLKLDRHADALVREQLPLLQISLDGWDEKSQAARGNVKGSFELLREGVRAVREARGSRPFPIIRILTAITRVNHAYLDRIQNVVAELGVRYWGLTNYFYLNRHAHARHQTFALMHGLDGPVAAHAIADDRYLTAGQVQDLRRSLGRVKQQSRRLQIRIAYAWNVDVEKYYSTCEPSRSSRCDLPCTRLDIQTDGSMALCVSGKSVGQIGRESITEVWRGRRVSGFRHLYERSRPMPMCFRCCVLSQQVRFDSHD